MKKLAILNVLLFSVIIAVLVAGCGKTYQGKYITTVIDEDPIDEFKVDNYVVLVVKNEERRTKEGWFYKFFIYEGGKRTRTFRLVARVVNKRAFYLEEHLDEKTKSHAYFPTEPAYEAVKDRVVALLKAGE